MRFEVRKVIRVRGSYLVYLPKHMFQEISPTAVEVYWQDFYVGITPVGERVAEVENGDVTAAVVAGYAAGLDKLYLKAPREEVERALEKVFGEMAPAGGGHVVRYVDRYLDMAEVVDRMLDALVYMLEGLTKETATLKTLQAVDDEVDRLRLTANRLCTKRPYPSCVFYIQLARFFERAVDHVLDLYREKPGREVWVLLSNAAARLKKAAEAGDPSAHFDFLLSIPSLRFEVLQKTEGQLQALHAVRVLDYLANSAEVYLDLAIHKSARFVRMEDAKNL
ncbi:MAG: hypothetical protein ACK4SY_05785 [Pyrobaculum sp.]